MHDKCPQRTRNAHVGNYDLQRFDAKGNEKGGFCPLYILESSISKKLEGETRPHISFMAAVLRYPSLHCA
jgi:hypothetical protein